MLIRVILVDDHLFWNESYAPECVCVEYVCICESDNSHYFSVDSIVFVSFILFSISNKRTNEQSKSPHKNYKPLERMYFRNHTSDSLSFQTVLLEMNAHWSIAWSCKYTLNGVNWMVVWYYLFFIEVHSASTYILYFSTISSFNLCCFFFFFNSI